ncbi:MAG: WD40/YVTN/BNR-like repeat-containing protein [Candidatus Dormibacteria bacterium]
MSQSRASSRRKAAAVISKPRSVWQSPYLWGGVGCMAIAVAVAMFLVIGKTAAPAALTTQQLADPAFIGPDLHSLVLDPRNPNHVFVGGHASAVVSPDGGKTLSQIKALQGLDAMSWAVAPDGLQQVVAGHSGLRVSRDGGTTWSDLTARLLGSDVHALGMNPLVPAQLFAYVMGKGVYVSQDQGQNWSLRGGQGLSLMGPMLVLPGANGVLGLDMQGGLVRSTDSGISWRPVGAGLMVSWIAADPADASHLIALGTTLEQSHDGGVTWSAVPGTLPSGVAAIAIGAGPGAPWYAGSLSNQRAVILRSTDVGKTWQVVTKTL